MKVIAYPADDYGCGYHRVIWPCEVLRAQGHDVSVVKPTDRQVTIGFDEGKVSGVNIPEDVDVVVFQRITDKRLIGVIPFLRERGVAVVIDVDDDLSAIHPSNPAWTFLDPHRARRETQAALDTGKIKLDQANRVFAQLTNAYPNSWINLVECCKLATLVTVSTRGLLKRYAAHGRGHVVNNYAPAHYFDVVHEDSDVVGWPATLHSHPNDPDAVGNALSRLEYDGLKFVTIGESLGIAQAFGLKDEPPGDKVTLDDWPRELSKLGIGIAPLADTLFNSRKSWLKPLEMSAVGVPWIASDRAEYVRLSGMGAGVLARKPKDWYRALRTLIDSPTLRSDLSEQGREVARGLRLDENAFRYVEAWETALKIERNALRVDVS